MGGLSNSNIEEMEYYYIRLLDVSNTVAIWLDENEDCTPDIRKAKMFTEKEVEKICEDSRFKAYNFKYVDNLDEAKIMVVESKFLND